MTRNEDDLGGRLPLLGPEELDAAQRQAFDAMVRKVAPWALASGFEAQTGDGRMIGPFNGVLYSPEIASAFLAWQSAEEERSVLDARTRQVVILSVGSVWRAPYELYAHRAVAGRAELPHDVVEALADGRPVPGLSATEETARRVALQITAERRIDDALFAAARDALGLRGLVDLLHLVGAYQTVCGLLNGFDVPAPER